jgi:hypothetical protein
MARKDTYTIHSKGKRALDDFRGDRIYGDVYAVLKYDPHGVEYGVYNVTCSMLGDWCECKAMMNRSCRHRDMVYIFKEAGQIDKDNLRYDFDKKEWIPAR